ncbi:hypothetical protein HDU93_000321 [Gonapodya sp. JEL0774]|nr:hypothetical protein HDU93_000321 [Gonapodya sp. JEL0774]
MRKNGGSLFDAISDNTESAKGKNHYRQPRGGILDRTTSQPLQILTESTTAMAHPTLNTALSFLSHPLSNTNILARYIIPPDTGYPSSSFFSSSSVDHNDPSLFPFSTIPLIQSTRVATYLLPLASVNPSLVDSTSVQSYAERMVLINPGADIETLPLPFYVKPDNADTRSRDAALIVNGRIPSGGVDLWMPPDSVVAAMIAWNFAKANGVQEANQGDNRASTSFSPSPPHFATSRGNLRTILLPGSDERRWVVLAQRRGPTVFLRRLRKSNMSKLGDLRGGFGFERMCTRLGMKWTMQCRDDRGWHVQTPDGPTVHTPYHSVSMIQYGELRILVDSEVDAVIPPGEELKSYLRDSDSGFGSHGDLREIEGGEDSVSRGAPMSNPNSLTIPHIELKLHIAHRLNPSTARHLTLQCILSGTKHAVVGIRSPTNESILSRVIHIPDVAHTLGTASGHSSLLGSVDSGSGDVSRPIRRALPLLSWLYVTMSNLPEGKVVFVCAEKDRMGRDSVAVRDARGHERWAVIKEGTEDVVDALLRNGSVRILGTD